MATGDKRLRVDLTASGPTQPAVRTVLEQLRAGTLPEPNVRALLDALGHGDCAARIRVHKEERDAERERADAEYQRCLDVKDRAERAEAERDEYSEGQRRALKDREQAEKEGDEASLRAMHAERERDEAHRTIRALLGNSRTTATRPPCRLVGDSRRADHVRRPGRCADCGGCWYCCSTWTNCPYCSGELIEDITEGASHA